MGVRMEYLLQCSQVCFAGQLLVGSYLGYVVLLTVPFEWIGLGYGTALLQGLCVALSVAAGMLSRNSIRRNSQLTTIKEFILSGTSTTSSLDHINSLQLAHCQRLFSSYPWWTIAMALWWCQLAQLCCQIGSSKPSGKGEADERLIAITTNFWKYFRSEKHRYILLLFFLISASVTVLVWSDFRLSAALQTDSDTSDTVDYQAYEYSGQQPDGIWAKLKYTGNLWLHGLMIAFRQANNPQLRQARQVITSYQVGYEF